MFNEQMNIQNAKKKNSSEEILKESLMEAGVGTAIVVGGPDAVKSVFGELTDATGARVEFLPSDLSPELAEFAQNMIGTVQSLAGPALALLAVYYGLRYVGQRLNGKAINN